MVTSSDIFKHKLFAINDTGISLPRPVTGNFLTCFTCGFKPSDLLSMEDDYGFKVGYQLHCWNSRSFERDIHTC